MAERFRSYTGCFTGLCNKELECHSASLDLTVIGRSATGPPSETGKQ